MWYAPSMSDGTPLDPMWDRPEFAQIRAQRDDPKVTSWEIARPLVELSVYNKPMTQAQHEYMARFMESNICKEFFCRLGHTMKEIPRCWLESPATDDQCVRCLTTHYAAMMPIKIPRSCPDGTPVRLIIHEDKGTERPKWEITSPGSAGLLGAYMLGAMIHPKVKPEKIVPLCLPAFSSNFENNCNHQCHLCPGLAHYDTQHDFAIAGNGTVYLDEFPPSVRCGIQKVLSGELDQWKELGVENPSGTVPPVSGPDDGAAGVGGR